MAKIRRYNGKVEGGVKELNEIAKENTEYTEEELAAKDAENTTEPEVQTEDVKQALENEAIINEATIVEEKEPEAPKQEVKESKPEVNTGLDKKAINAILKDESIGIFDRLDELIKSLPSQGSKVVKSLVALLHLRNQLASETVLNREQKYFTREFKKLLELPQNQFDESMVYVNWTYKELTNVDTLAKAGINTMRNGASPLDPTNIVMYIANKDDQEMFTFLYLMTLLDIKANSPELKDKPVDVSKTSVQSGLTDTHIERLNKFYAR